MQGRLLRGLTLAANPINTLTYTPSACSLCAVCVHDSPHTHTHTHTGTHTYTHTHARTHTPSNHRRNSFLKCGQTQSTLSYCTATANDHRGDHILTLSYCPATANEHRGDHILTCKILGALSLLCRRFGKPEPCEQR